MKLSLSLGFILISCMCLSQNSTPWPSTCDYEESFDSTTTSQWIIDDRPSTSSPRIEIGPSVNGSGAVNFINTPDHLHVVRVYRPLPITLCESWLTTGEFEVNGIGMTDPIKGVGHFICAFTSTSAEMMNDVNKNIVNNDMVGITVTGGSSQGLSINLATNIDSQLTYYSLGYGSLSMYTEYRYSFRRIDSLNISVKVEEINSGQILIDTAVTINGGLPIELNYMQIGNNPHGWQTRFMTGWVDNICLSNCNSIGEREWTIDDLNVSFNPAAGELQFSRPIEMPTSYEVLDLTGRIVQRGELEQYAQELAIVEVPKGIYLFRMKRKDGMYYVQKFMND